MRTATPSSCSASRLPPPPGWRCGRWPPIPTGSTANSDAAGAIASPATLARATAAGLGAQAVLDRHDSCRLFEALGDLIRTNVNDFRAILVA